MLFLVDGKTQYTATQPPFQAEVRLAKYPTEQVVRVEGYDPSGNWSPSTRWCSTSSAAQLEVPHHRAQGAAPRRPARIRAKAAIVVPEERKLERSSSWSTTKVAAAGQAALGGRRSGAGAASRTTAYITVAAFLDDGTRAEDVQFLNNPDYLEEVEVDLVELYTTV